MLLFARHAFCWDLTLTKSLNFSNHGGFPFGTDSPKAYFCRVYISSWLPCWKSWTLQRSHVPECRLVPELEVLTARIRALGKIVIVLGQTLVECGRDRLAMVWITPPDFGFIIKQSTPAQMQIDQFFKWTSKNSNEPPEEKKKWNAQNTSDKQPEEECSQPTTTRKKQRTNVWFVIIIKS